MNINNHKNTWSKIKEWNAEAPSDDHFYGFEGSLLSTADRVVCKIVVLIVLERPMAARPPRTAA